jgi:hypothetical protein
MQAMRTEKRHQDELKKRDRVERMLKLNLRMKNDTISELKRERESPQDETGDEPSVLQRIKYAKGL